MDYEDCIRCWHEIYAIHATPDLSDLVRTNNVS